jgi:serine/threonine-protein kinase HipA
VFGFYPQDKYHHRSYANIAALLWAETGEAGTYEFFRRLVFSVLIGNGDMHLKNWSLLYPDRRTPVLSPAYDFVATLPYIPNDTLALTFGGSRSSSGITADRCGDSPMPAACLQVHYGASSRRSLIAPVPHGKTFPRRTFYQNN